MTNINWLINMLMEIQSDNDEKYEPFFIDDGGASSESAVRYHINCPYYAGDERALCYEREERIDDGSTCSDCKMQWLFDEVDE